MRRVFPTPEGVELELKLAAGSIELATTDAAETVVELERLDGAELEPDEARIEHRHASEGADRVVVAVERRTRLFGTSRQYRLRVYAPHGAAADVATASADVHGHGRFGSVAVRAASADVAFETVAGALTAKTASGDVSVELVEGPATVQTASGDVRLGRTVADVSVRSASGDVAVDEADGGVNVATASGDVRVASVAHGVVEIQSASGDLTVGVARGASVWVDARSTSGDLVSELELDEQAPGDGDGPLVELRLNSLSGDIRLVRAADRPVGSR